MDPDQTDRVATQFDSQNYDFLLFSRPFLMADIIAILIRGQLKNLAQIIIFYVNTL